MYSLHINTHHILLIVKHTCCQCFCQLCLADAGRTKERNEPIGFVGSLIPALERMIASVTFLTPSSWPMTRLCSSSSKCRILVRSPSVSFATGMPVHLEMTIWQSLHRLHGHVPATDLSFLPFLLQSPAVSEVSAVRRTAVLLLCSDHKLLCAFSISLFIFSIFSRSTDRFSTECFSLSH